MLLEDVAEILQHGNTVNRWLNRSTRECKSIKVYTSSLKYCVQKLAPTDFVLDEVLHAQKLGYVHD
jgi:hypothetical protein